MYLARVTLEKGFLRPQNQLSLSKISIFWGLFLGLLIAFCLYSGAFILFEKFRCADVFAPSELYIFTEDEMSFYKWFYASVSVIIGQAMAFKYWVAKSRQQFKTFNSSRIRLRNIGNDQSNLISSFLHWFSHCSVLFTLFFGLGITYTSYDDCDFYANHQYFFVLIPIVLWLNSWVGLARLFRTKIFIPMTYSAIVVALLSFGISKINIVDYKSYNSTYLKNHAFANYEFNLPSSILGWKLKRISIHTMIDIGYKKNNSQTSPTIFYQKEVISINDIPNILIDEYDRKQLSSYPFITISLMADQRVPMHLIDSLKNISRSLGVNNIIYSLSNGKTPSRIQPVRFKSFYENIPPPRSYNSSLGISPPPPPPPFDITNYSNRIDVHLTNQGKIILNGLQTDMDSISLKIRFLLLSDSNYVINFTKDSTCTLGQYINAQTEIRLPIYALRHEASSVQFNKKYHWLNSNEQRIIKRRYPLIIREEF
ncbi:MAG: hypothetical protein COA58_06755 [Bacteroidetes bacterium]|nr:MAG: hypothetical protein COA58_06755 [Bacteroidota bacterium]